MQITKIMFLSIYAVCKNITEVLTVCKDIEA